MSNELEKSKFRVERDDDFESHKLLQLDAIQTDVGTEDCLVADIYELGLFNEFIAQAVREARERELEVLRLTLRGENPNQYRPKDMVSMSLVEEAIEDRLNELREKSDG